MKRKLLKSIILVLLFSISVIVVSACNRPITNTYNVNYNATIGGFLSGDPDQLIKHGDNASSITAIANDGYVFVKWSDGVTDATRCDSNVISNINVTAEFEQITYTIKFCAGIGGSLSGDTEQNLVPGSTSTTVTAIPDDGYEFFVWSNGQDTPEITLTPEESTIVTAIFVESTYQLPVVSIYTENFTPINTKENYVKCTVLVSNTNSAHELSPEPGKIKLRGNSTAYLPKSPYKLKFDKKVDLFGNGSAKTWTIIANYVDCSLIRNYIAYSLGDAFDNLDYTTTIKTVEVYLNGKYDGVYLICEQVESGTNRVDIDVDYDNPNTGYLIELDDRAPEEGVEGIDYFNIESTNTHNFVYEGKTLSYAIKSPDPEDGISAEHVAYIKQYIQQCMTALDGNDFDAVMELIDVYSFADGYIIDELMHCVDIGISSFYIYKDKNGKLYRGPLWDYDLSSGNYSNFNAAVDPNNLWAKSANIWYNKLLSHEQFIKIVATRLAELDDTIDNVISDCYKFAINHRNAFERNFERWDILGVSSNNFTPEEIYSLETWEEHVDYLMNWLSLSLQNLKTSYPITN